MVKQVQSFYPDVKAVGHRHENIGAEKAGIGVNVVRRVTEEGIHPRAFVKRNRHQRHPQAAQYNC